MNLALARCVRDARLAIALGALAACSSFGAEDRLAADGGLDGGADATSDGGLAPCSARSVKDPAHFCDDFDAPGNLLANWTTRLSGDGKVGDTTAALSPPRAVVASFRAGNASTSAVIAHKRAPDLVTTGKTRLVFSFAVRIDRGPYPAGANGVATVASLWFDPPECSSSGGQKQRALEVTIQVNGDLHLDVKGFADKCADSGAGDDFAAIRLPFRLADLTASGFHRFAFEVEKRGCAGDAGPSATLRIDGVASQCHPLVVDPFTKLDAFYVELGPSAYGGPFADTTFVYDDVSVDFD